MGKAKYDWYAADRAIRNASAEVMTASRHINSRKPVNVLNDLLAAECELLKVRKALLGEPREADPHVR